MSDDFRLTYLTDIRRTFRNYKALADAAVAQVDDAALTVPLDPDGNSIAVILQHVSGNLRSRFADFLTTDGEKPDRNRDREFELQSSSRATVLERWDQSWTLTLGAIDGLTPDDLARIVHIRGEAFSVVEALNRAASHTAYHVGQIVFLAKHFQGPRWKSLSVPKGKSEEHLRGSFKQGILPPRSSP